MLTFPKRLPFMHKQSKVAGLAPGTLVHIGEQRIAKPIMSSIQYDASSIEERPLENLDISSIKTGVRWVNIDGLHDTQLIASVGKQLSVHPLTLEDILNTGQRPKFEEMDDYLFAVLKMIYIDSETHELQIEQVSIILKENEVISFQEQTGDVFEQVRGRIRKKKGRIRDMGPDYLFYTLIDAVVDHYFSVMEVFSDRIEGIEDKLITSPMSDDLQEIYMLKRQLLLVRKAAWPLREAISTLHKSEHDLLHKDTSIYFRDVYDHTIQTIDTIETLRDMISGMLDVYLSSVSNKMNEVMKVLTIFAAIFIPLTFIAGIYGMNFKYMPELDWSYGYFTVLGIMFIVCAIMLLYFKRKHWF